MVINEETGNNTSLETSTQFNWMILLVNVSDVSGQESFARSISLRCPTRDRPDAVVSVTAYSKSVTSRNESYVSVSLEESQELSASSYSLCSDSSYESGMRALSLPNPMLTSLDHTHQQCQLGDAMSLPEEVCGMEREREPSLSYDEQESDRNAGSECSSSDEGSESNSNAEHESDRHIQIWQDCAKDDGRRAAIQQESTAESEADEHVGIRQQAESEADVHVEIIQQAESEHVEIQWEESKSEADEMVQWAKSKADDHVEIQQVGSKADDHVEIHQVESKADDHVEIHQVESKADDHVEIQQVGSKADEIVLQAESKADEHVEMVQQAESKADEIVQQAESKADEHMEMVQQAESKADEHHMEQVESKADEIQQVSGAGTCAVAKRVDQDTSAEDM